MKPGQKSKKTSTASIGPRKTKEDFLRWLARKKKTAVPEVNPVNPSPTEALMVWADDGGPVT
jgi:hypothetical protein